MRAAATTLSADSIALIDYRYRLQTSRTCWIETPEGAVVVKGQRPARGPVRYRLLSWLAGALKNPLMIPVPNYGGVKSQRIEVDRLRRLASAGLSVPNVLYETESYFVMQGFPGVPLDSKLALPKDQSSPAFDRGLKAISLVHAFGECLSQGFARNILIDDVDGLWFIDHEDDPLEVLTLPQAQARDWLLYLLSSVWLNRSLWGEWNIAWREAYGSMPADTQNQLTETGSKIRWLTHLPRSRQILGRDVTQAQALSEFLNME